MENTLEVSRARKDSTIETTLCEDCFCAIPVEQEETHARWHERKTK